MLNLKFRILVPARRDDQSSFRDELYRTKPAFSLVEILVVVFIMAVVFMAFYTVSTVGTRYIIEAKNRLAATAFVNEKMEIARNLKYDSIGLQGGIPDGNILQDENDTANGRTFHVHTLVKYEDDPLDGLYPADVISNDYKTVKVTVSWQDSSGQTQSVVSVSRFVPPGLETTDGGAPLAINVKGSDGTAVPQASVHIVNNAVVPAINYTVESDDTGHIMIPAAPASLGGYQFTITKNGYETVATVDPASVLYTPTYRHEDVLLGALNMYDYIQDHLSNLTVKTADYQNNPVGSIIYSIKGGKVIGRDASNVDVLNMDATGTTGAASGEKAYAAISPGNYAISPNANAQYAFIDYDPSVYQAVLVPDSDMTYTLRFADKNINALSLTIIDSVDSSPVADAKATLTDGGGADIFANKSASLRGIVFYPDTATPLLAGTYTIKVEAPGYVTQTQSIDINKLTGVQMHLVKS